MIKYNAVFKKEITFHTEENADPVATFLLNTLPKLGGLMTPNFKPSDLIQSVIPYMEKQIGIEFDREAFNPITKIDFSTYDKAKAQKFIAVHPLSSAFATLDTHSKLTLNNLEQHFLTPLKKLEENKEQGDTTCLTLLPHIVDSSNFFAKIGESFAQRALTHILPMVNLEEAEEKDDISYALNRVMVSTLAFLLLKMHLFLVKVDLITNKSISEGIKNHFYDSFLLEYRPNFIQKILGNHPSQIPENFLHPLIRQEHLELLYGYIQKFSLHENARNKKIQIPGKHLASTIATLYSTAHLQDYCKALDIALLREVNIEDIEPLAILQETIRMREDITQVKSTFIDLVFLIQKILNCFDRLEDNTIFVKSNLNRVEAQIAIDKLTPIEKYAILYVLAKEFSTLINKGVYLLNNKFQSLVTLFNHLISTVEISQQKILSAPIQQCFISHADSSQEEQKVEISKLQEALLSPTLIHHLSEDLEKLTPKEKYTLLDTLVTLSSPFSIDNNSAFIQKDILQPLLNLLKQLTLSADGPLNAKIAQQCLYLREMEIPLTSRLGIIKLQEILLSLEVIENISRLKDANKWLLWTKAQFSRCSNSALESLKQAKLERLDTALQEYMSWMAIYLRLVAIPKFLSNKLLLQVKTSFIELATNLSSHLKIKPTTEEQQKLAALLRDFVKQLSDIKAQTSISSKLIHKIIEPTAYNALEKAIIPVQKRKKSKKKKKPSAEVIVPASNKESTASRNIFDLEQHLATECLTKNEAPSDENATKTIKASKIPAFLGKPTTLSNKFFALAADKEKKYNQDTLPLKNDLPEATSTIEITERGKAIKIDLLLSANKNVIDKIKLAPSNSHCAHIVLSRDSVNIHHDEIHLKESISPFKNEDLFKVLKSKSNTTAFIQQKKGHYQPLISFELSVENFYEVIEALDFENKHKPSLSRTVSSYSFKDPNASTEDKKSKARETQKPAVNSALKRSESSFHLVKKAQPLEKQEPLPHKKRSILSKISFLNSKKSQSKVNKESARPNVRQNNIEPVLFEWPDTIDNESCLWQVYAKAVPEQVPHLEMMLLRNQIPDDNRYRIIFHSKDECLRLKGYFFNFNKGAYYIIPAEENYVPVLEQIGTNNKEEKNLYMPPDEILAFYFSYCIANNIFYQYSDNGEYIPARDAPITPVVGYLSQDGYMLPSF